jgi:inorganic triphosphatase YgiF
MGYRSAQDSEAAGHNFLMKPHEIAMTLTAMIARCQAGTRVGAERSALRPLGEAGRTHNNFQPNGVTMADSTDRTAWDFLAEHAKTCDQAYDFLDEQARPEGFNRDIWLDGKYLRRQLYRLSVQDSATS